MDYEERFFFTLKERADTSQTHGKGWHVDCSYISNVIYDSELNRGTISGNTVLIKIESEKHLLQLKLK